jgi:hypothetical protein
MAVEDDDNIPDRPANRQIGKELTPDSIEALTLRGRPPTLAERFQNYYQNPGLPNLLSIFREAWKAGLFKLKNGRISPITVIFFSAALDMLGQAAWEKFLEEVLSYTQRSQGLIEKLLGKPSPAQERLNALSIIAFLSEDPEKLPLRSFFSRTLSPGQDIKQELERAEMQLVWYRPRPLIDNPLQIDQIWAIFYANASPEALLRVIEIANGEQIASEEVVRSKTRYPRQLITQGAAFSLIVLARLQERVAHLIYDNLANYEGQPVYGVLLSALQAAGVIAALEPDEQGETQIKWSIPPDWL